MHLGRIRRSCSWGGASLCSPAQLVTRSQRSHSSLLLSSTWLYREAMSWEGAWERLGHRRFLHTLALASAGVVDVSGGEDFYSLLGVSPQANVKEIKKAYYDMMRQCHPDVSDSEDDEEVMNFCIVLNEIYETLTDPDKRAIYDEVAGFSEESINPFMDPSFPRDQVFVDEYTCIGCRNCTNVAPSSFAIEEDFGRARVYRQGADTEEKLQEAIDTCPVSCIHWVSSPQLALLEEAMVKMDRVAVWSLMSGGGANKDVFTEASLAWEKRRAKARKKQEQATWAAFWSGVAQASEGAMGAQMQDAARRASAAYEEGTKAGTRDMRDIAALSARAARASRVWKQWQESEQANGRKLALSASSSSWDE